MTHPLRAYGPATGPLGFPMTDRAARTLETILKSLPKEDAFAYRKAVVAKSPTEVSPGERSDVSWISTESVDRSGEVMRAKGMNATQYRDNPLVTMGHCYWMPPVGKSLWQKAFKDGELTGIKAKTVYPAQPESWTSDDPWPPDKVFALVQAGMLNGKSVGFLPLKVHTPTDKEMQDPALKDCNLIIDEWLLLEYACVFMPMNQDALVEQVSKGAIDLPKSLLKAMGLDDSLFQKQAPVAPPGLPIRFTPLAEIEKAMLHKINQLDVTAIFDETINRMRGRV